MTAQYTPLSSKQIQEHAVRLKTKWEVLASRKIRKKFLFKNFAKAMAFVNKVAKIAEQQEHHPDIRIFNWNNVSIELWTHSIGGLSENDFILASKIELLMLSK